MKVGIMSMQRIPNNGSFLQSYSLMKNIEQMGHEVVFSDYVPGEVLVEKNQKKVNKYVEIFGKIKKRICFPHKNKAVYQDNLRIFSKWEREFCSRMLPLLKLTDEKSIKPETELLVIGSDEVFNVLQPNPAVGYAKQLFGFDNNSQKVISYAASFGNTSMDGLKKYGIDGEVKEMLSKMDGISVRDVNSVEIVSQLLNQKPEYHVDPVFLYDYEDEVPKSVPEKDYIVVYAYSCRISQKEAAQIVRFARKFHKKIVCLAGVQEYLDGFVSTNPFETLAYIKNADYIITDTFHGTVFSIKYNKPFATLVRMGEGASYGNSNKLVDLLNRFGLGNHILSNVKDMENVLICGQDYANVNRQISEEKQKSLIYLKKYLEE